MDITRRVPAEAERREAVQAISIFQPRLRRLVKQEVARGYVEILRFRAIRAWNIISCPGPPCCPNTWLLEGAEGQFVWVTSWRDLTAHAERFPGSDVTVERWEESHRTIWGAAAGPSIPPFGGTHMGHLEPGTVVEIYERGRLPAEIANAIASV